MSAPLVVNTKDGVCWTRRTVTSGGIALYAPESVKTCPDFVMATEAELAEHGIVGSADALPMPVREEPRDLAATFDRDETAEERQARWEKAAWTAGRTVDRNTLGVYMAVADAEQQKLADDWARSVTSSDAELKRLRARVAELEAAAKEIQRLHTDSPMGPCPVCIDGDAMVRGDDYTLPYPCPTARLAGAKDCDPPSQRKASRPLVEWCTGCNTDHNPDECGYRPGAGDAR